MSWNATRGCSGLIASDGHVTDRSCARSGSELVGRHLLHQRDRRMGICLARMSWFSRGATESEDCPREATSGEEDSNRNESNAGVEDGVAAIAILPDDFTQTALVSRASHPIYRS